MKRCNQCYREKSTEEFIRNGGERTWCNYCASIRKTGVPSRRVKLDAPHPLRVRWIPDSKNQKLGRIPASMSSANTCPDACVFKDSGCFAEFGKLRLVWERVPELGDEWGRFCERVKELEPGTFWRHNVMGDLPGVGDELDARLLDELVSANRGKRGFTFTHKPLTEPWQYQAVARAVARDFAVNLSANSPEHADDLARLGIAPVAVVMHTGAPARGNRTPEGRHIVMCPAETSELTCRDCQLCAVTDRKSIVGFWAHGQWKKRVDQIVTLRLAR